MKTPIDCNDLALLASSPRCQLFGTTCGQLLTFDRSAIITTSRTAIRVGAGQLRDLGHGRPGIYITVPTGERVGLGGNPNLPCSIMREEAVFMPRAEFAKGAARVGFCEVSGQWYVAEG